MSYSGSLSVPALDRLLRKDALEILQTGVQAADPYQAVKRCLTFSNNRLAIVTDPDDSRHIRTAAWPKIHLLAFGKAACAMIKAAIDSIPETMLAGPGIAVTNYENVVSINNVEVIGASHPLPNEAGLKAARKIAEWLNHTQKNELVLVLISGGGSALLPYPAGAVTLAEKIAVTDLLLASGATINEINCVRKHLSLIKGGGLARMALPADLHALILSDVIGDDLSAIASGPTVPDNTGYADAITICQSKNIWTRVPAVIREHLELGRLGAFPETAKPGDPAFCNAASTLIGSNSISIRAMLKTGAALGYEPRLYNDKLDGEARQAAEQLAVDAKRLLASGSATPLALIAGGETTVAVTGTGLGGRNQEMALAFAVAAEQHDLSLNSRWLFISAGSDGRDGPTDAAGGIVDGGTIKRLRESAIIPTALLNNNDSYHALKISQDLLVTGSTGTNVADLQVLLIHPIIT